MTGGNGSRGYAHESTSRTGRDSHRARSSNQAPKRSSTAGKAGKDANGSSLHGGAQGRHSTTHSNAHDSRSYHHRTDRESHQTSSGYPNNSGGYINPHMPGTSTSKQAPRAHSSKHLGGTSTSRTTAGGGFASDHALVHAQSNHLNQSKRSVATAHHHGNAMENSMKMSQHGGYSAHNNTSHQMHGSEPQSYAKQPRKAQSQDRIPNSATAANSAAYQGAASSHLS